MLYWVYFPKGQWVFISTRSRLLHVTVAGLPVNWITDS
jgi:hypothetical protein